MDLMDLLKAAGGGDSVGEVGNAVGLGSSDASKLVESLGPALMRGLQKNTASESGLDGLAKALRTGGHDRYIDNPGSLRDAAATMDGNRILGHIFGSKDVSRNVAGQAAEETGIDAGLIKKALPLVAGLVMGAMNKKSSAGRDVGASAGGLGPLGALIGAATGGGKAGRLDDVLGMAKKFF